MTSAAPTDIDVSLTQYIEPPPWHTEDWDTGIIEGESVPGLMSFSSLKRGPKWDRKPAAGVNGETQTFKGWNNAEFTIEIRTWTRAQYDDFVARILPILEPTPGKEAPKEVSIQHPIMAARKIESFKIDSLDGPKADFKDGYVVWTVDAFQAIKKAPAPQGTGKPGITPCEQARQNWENACYQYQLAMNALYSADPADADAYLAAQQNAQAAYDRQSYCDDVLRENGCDKERSPGSAAQGEGAPPP